MPSFLSVPPTSLKPLKRYLIKLAGSGKRLYAVLTEIGLEKATSGSGIGYSRCTFAYAGDLAPSEAVVSGKLRASLMSVVTRGVPTAPQVAPEESAPETIDAPPASVPADPDTDPDAPE